MEIRTLALLTTATASLALSGCVKLGSKAPPQLLTISPVALPSDGRSVSSQGLPTLSVVTPDVPRKLDTTRVPVQVTPTTIAYVTDAQWAEPPRKMFARLLIDAIALGGQVFVVSDDQYGMPAGRRLVGELVDFGIDGEAREAIVTFDAVISSADGGTAMRRRFTARAAVRDIEADKVAEPISRAANQVASDVAAWVRSN